MVRKLARLLRCSDKTFLFIPFSQLPDYWILFHFKRSIPLRFARLDSHRGSSVVRWLLKPLTRVRVLTCIATVYFIFYFEMLHFCIFYFFGKQQLRISHIELKWNTWYLYNLGFEFFDNVIILYYNFDISRFENK